MAANAPSTLRFWIGGVLAGVGAIAPVATIGDGVTIIDMVIGGALWFGIGVGIGAVIDSVRRKRNANVGTQWSPTPPSFPSAAPTAPPASTAPMAPVTEDGWYLDPFGRFHYRYFHGGVWTDQVSTNGRTSTDAPG